MSSKLSGNAMCNNDVKFFLPSNYRRDERVYIGAKLLSCTDYIIYVCKSISSSFQSKQVIFPLELSALIILLYLFLFVPIIEIYFYLPRFQFACTSPLRLRKKIILFEFLRSFRFEHKAFLNNINLLNVNVYHQQLIDKLNQKKQLKN